MSRFRLTPALTQQDVFLSCVQAVAGNPQKISEVASKSEISGVPSFFPLERPDIMLAGRILLFIIPVTVKKKRSKSGWFKLYSRTVLHNRQPAFQDF